MVDRGASIGKFISEKFAGSTGKIFKAGLSTVSVQRAIKDILKQEADHKKGLSHF